MQHHKIQSQVDDRALHEGRFENFATCLEDAVAHRIALHGANLKNRNLANACLDDGIFPGADFSGSNLSGANLSEADLAGAHFMGADMVNACMAYANLRGCNFDNAAFGATDITGADISGSLFSALSCFSLDFIRAEKMDGCRYKTGGGAEIPLPRPPVVIRGLSERLIVFTGTHCIAGTEAFACKDIPALPDQARLNAL